MPTAITSGLASAKGFGFTMSKPAPPTVQYLVVAGGGGGAAGAASALC